MKRTLFLITLAASVNNIHAAVGDTVTGNGNYVAEGVVCSNFGTGYLQVNKTDSTRLYDSTKKAEWVSGSGDSNMCWLHASANAIQYWQSYYGVFAKPQTGNYYDHSSNTWKNDAEKPLPYGRIGTEDAAYGDSSNQVPDARRLEVARDIYKNMDSNQGGTFKWASEWFFRGADEWPSDNTQGSLLTNSPNTGGYYANYFGSGTFFKEDLSYTTEYSVARDSIAGVHHSSTGQSFGNTDIGRVKELLLEGFGIHDGQQTESGLIPFIGTWNSSTGVGHMLTCYGFTTDNEGNLKSIIIADNNDNISSGSALKELFIKVQNDRIELYTNSSLTRKYTPSGSGVNYIGEISFINTPQVLKDMLAEYSDTANEAQVWNGGATEWKAQKADTEELPGASTGWDVNVNGNKIAEEHQGYYHTYATEGRSVLFDDHAAADKRSITIVGTVAADSMEVAAAGYEFKAGDAAELKAGTKLTVRSMASLHSEVALNLSDLTLEAGAELSSDKTITVSGDFQVNGMPEATTFNLRSRVTPEAAVNADLDLTGASSIVLESTVNMNGHRLLLNSETPITLDYNVEGNNMPFFTNVKELLVTTAEGEAVTLTPGTDVTQYFSLYHDGEQLPDVSIIYTITGNIGIAAVPEPGTATLSLLALAALVSRRRRR